MKLEEIRHFQLYLKTEFQVSSVKNVRKFLDNFGPSQDCFREKQTQKYMTQQIKKKMKKKEKKRKGMLNKISIAIRN